MLEITFRDDGLCSGKRLVALGFARGGRAHDRFRRRRRRAGGGGGGGGGGVRVWWWFRRTLGKRFCGGKRAFGPVKTGCRARRYALPAVDMAALGETYAAAAGVAFCHAPFALAPFPWPRSEFERCVELQPLLGALVEAVAHDGEWLEKTLAETVLSDDFTARVFAVHSANPSPQTVSLGLLRSDYMLDWSCAEKDAAAPLSVGRSLQVELNTIASSFACLSATVSELHAFSHSKKQHASSHKADDKDAPSSLPANGAATGLARGIAAAHLEYERQLHCSSSAPVGGGGGPNALPLRCVMVVQPGERNQMDQRMLEHELWSSHGVALERVTLKQLHDEAVLDHETGALSLKGKFEVSVAYLRKRALRTLSIPTNTLQRLCVCGPRAPSRRGTFLKSDEIHIERAAAALSHFARAKGLSRRRPRLEYSHKTVRKRKSQISIWDFDDLAQKHQVCVCVCVCVSSTPFLRESNAGPKSRYIRWHSQIAGAGYSPDDYSSEEEWSARAVLERSRCVKCPTAAYQLAGTKKVQQALAQPGALERFVSQHDAEKLRAVFAGLYDLDVGKGFPAYFSHCFWKCPFSQSLFCAKKGRHSSTEQRGLQSLRTCGSFPSSESDEGDQGVSKPRPLSLRARPKEMMGFQEREREREKVPSRCGSPGSLSDR